MVSLLALAVTLGASSPAQAERYSNAKYGMSFELPAGSNVCRSPAPLPNHGLLFRPVGVTSPPCDDDIESGARYTSVDAHFDADGSVTPANFVAVECPQLAYDSQGRVTAMEPPAHPGGLAWAACRIDGADGSIKEVLFGQRSGIKGVPATDYTLVLKTTPQAYMVDHAAFVRWLATFRLKTPI